MNCQVVLICKSLKRNRNRDVKKKKERFSALLKCPTKHPAVRLVPGNGTGEGMKRRKKNGSDGKGEEKEMEKESKKKKIGKEKRKH